jgi:hypothetical protein
MRSDKIMAADDFPISGVTTDHHIDTGKDDEVEEPALARQAGTRRQPKMPLR